MISRKAILVLMGATLTMLTLRADTIDVETGASMQNFILTGQGPEVIGGDTFGTYTVQQGSCATLAGTTTCTLSGALASGGSPGFTSGTYSFVTTFAASDVNPITAISEGPDPGPDANFFNYSSFAPDLSMVLDLVTSGGDYQVPLVTNGAFDGPGFSFAYTDTEVCTEVSTCAQANVGLVAGSTISGPVTISASFSSAVPEPSSVGLLLPILLGVAFCARKRFAKRP